MDYLQKIVGDFETHNAAGIRECFMHGIDPNQQHKGKPLVYEMINMYLRGPGFKKCIQVFVDFGLQFPDKALLAVLLDDAVSLEQQVKEKTALSSARYSLDGTFTPLFEVSLLHICAEYNHLQCAKVLVAHGADVNGKAGMDSYGFGGQTPIFHTVNQHANACLDSLQFLIEQQANLSTTVTGLIWGKGYEWETFIPSVNPISYAMMGLLPQFQRTERAIYEVVSLLLKAGYGIEYQPANVPNKYLGN